ncbi:MAG: PQQ-binding-like beta-propeller repeat protein [Candidatus Coatesbacteria bacterium]|nr:MAG: PQQ-binding-like beta-propeller repeat protein [Candidatus Coatesbacteria bacterium]
MGKSIKSLVAVITGVLIGTFFFGCDSISGPGPTYGPVRNLTGEYDGTTVHLAWDSTESGEEIGYEIQRDHETLAELQKKQRFYDDDSAERDNVYDYAVLPVYEHGTVPEYSNVTISTWSYYLWVGDNFNVRKVTPDDGTYMGHVETPGGWLSGLTNDGTDFWMAEVVDSIIYKFDADTGETLSTFDSPCAQPTGLAWDGEHLWVVGYYGDVFEINPNTGDVVASYSFDDRRWTGATFDGEYIWLSEDDYDGPDDNLSTLNRETGELTVAFDYPGKFALGLTWHNGRLWAVDEDEVVELDPDTGDKINSFDEDGEGITVLEEKWD